MTSQLLNFHQLWGRLVQEPRAVETQGGHRLLRFSLVYHTLRAADSEGSHANFIEVEVWGKLAEKYQPLLKKGLQIVVTGELVQRRWQAADGRKREKYILVAHALRITDRAHRTVMAA
ncbi:MAG: single-stranded DNA-binding protein [Leptospiraceae bacterium]|nr:single-stranded DNA-binding protein [Leptospiraceae bacterium]MDW8306744.1 single-stranded DNA-binding protein [Leptospiraceae bacterium]